MSNTKNTMPLPLWNGITPVSLALPTATGTTSEPTDLEPSGLTIYFDGADPWIFLVSDNGMLTKAGLGVVLQQRPENPTWRGPLSIPDETDPTTGGKEHANDYECVTFAGGNVMLGVEGDRNGSPPRILRFDQGKDSSNESSGVGKLTGSSWVLNGCIPAGGKSNAGMEALTLLTTAAYPADWTPTSPHYSGVFLVAVQASPGKIYVYDLPQGSDRNGNPQADQQVSPLSGVTGLEHGALTVPAPSAYTTARPVDDGSTPLLSDLFFDPESGTLFALYDGGSRYDYLQGLSLDKETGVLSELWSQRCPWYGCEGVAVLGEDLYIAIDNNADNDASDGVYMLEGFLS